jgi:hypothetical protein
MKPPNKKRRVKSVAEADDAHEPVDTNDDK